DAYFIHAGQTLSVTAPGLIANDSDGNSDALSSMLVTGPAHGSVTLNPNGSFVFMAAPGYLGQDAFSYKVSDGVASSNTATVALNIVDAAPVAFNDAYVLHSTTLSVPAATGVLSSD